MYGTHHKTGKKVRLLQHASSTWRDNKTLVWLTPEDDLSIPWGRFDTGVVGSATYEALKDKIDIDIVISDDADWIKENYKNVRIVLAPKAALDIIGLSFFQENKIPNILCLDELHTIYSFLEKPWDGTNNDACILVAIILRFGVTYPLQEATRNTFSLRVESSLKTPQKLYFITQYYKSKSKRNAEINQCLDKNIENPYIDKIILLNEEEFTFTNPKIQQIVIGKRLHYDDVIRYISTLEDCIVVFANADIYLDHTIRYTWSTKLDNKFIALLRYDVDAQGKSTIFGPRADSQDCWIISSASVKSRKWDYESINFSFGVSGCDNAITLEMLRMKYLVVNPALTIKTHHVHNSDIRTYTKDVIVDKDTYLYIQPSGLQDMEAIVQLPIKNINTHINTTAFDRPLNCAKAATYCAMLAKAKRYVYTDGPNTFEKQYIPIYKFEDIFQTNSGLVYGYDKIYVGPSKIATEYWSKSHMSTLSASMNVKKAYVVPLPQEVSCSVENYFLYYLPKILLLRKLYGNDGAFWLPNKPAFTEALSILKLGKTPLIPHETPLTYVGEAYVWFPSDNLEVTKEEVEVLRSYLDYTQEDCTAVYMDGVYITKSFIKDIEDRYTNVKIIFPETSFDRQISILQSASLFIAYNAPKYLWAMKAQSRFIDIQNEMELNGELHHIASAASLDHVIHIVPKGPMTPLVRAKIIDSLSTGVASTIPTIYVPNAEGFFAHAGDSFREIIDMWEERGYINKMYGTNKNVWLGGVGEILLYDRPTYDWIKNADANEQVWKKALFGNPKPIGPNSQPWSFWARRPRLVEAMLDNPIEKSNNCVFYGVIENAVQNANRTRYDWSTCCDKFVLAKDKAEYTQQEYLNRMAKAKYGLCLAGYGKKCHREVECMAFGTVPVCAPEVDMDSYANPPVEGVHYIRVENPKDVLEKLARISETEWQVMSDACRAWYKTNCSIDGMWNLTKKLVF